MTRSRSGRQYGKRRRAPPRGKPVPSPSAPGQQPPGAPGRNRRPRRRPGGGSRRDLWLALAVLAVLLAAAYRNVVFDGRSIVYSNCYNPLDFRFMPQNYGRDFVPPSLWTDQNLLFTANFNDGAGPVWQWEPDARFLRRGLLAGELPLWNPYVGAGTPEMANLVPAVAFPPYLVMVLLGDGVGLRNAYHLLLALAAGAFTFLFLRRHGLSRLACLMGAAAFMLSGALAQNVGSFLGQTVACMPFTLYLTRCFLDNPTPRMGVGLAAGYAMVALASFPPILVTCFGFAVLYGVAAILLEPSAAAVTDTAGQARTLREAAAAAREPPVAGAPRVRTLIRFASWAALALGLVAFYYLPAFALARAAPQVDRAYAEAARFAVQRNTLLELASPILIRADEILRQAPPSEAIAGGQPQLPYAGWVPLLLCLLAVPRPGGRARTLWVAGWGGLALVLLKLLGWPPAQWIAYLPVLKNIHFAHYLGNLADLLVALLAALGLERLRRGRVTMPFAAAAGAAGVLLLLWIRWRVAPAGTFKGPWAGQWEGEWQLLVGLAAVSAVLFAAGAYLARRARSTAVVAAALLALFAGEAVVHTYYPRPKAFDVWREPPDYVRALERAAGLGRVFAKNLFPANAGGAFGVSQLESLMAFNAPRVFELYRRYANPGASLFLTNPTLIPPEGVMDRAAIGLLVLPVPSPEQETEARGRGYALLYEDDYARIFKRSGSPHFFFSSDYEVAGGDRALEEIGRLPPGREVVLEAAPPFPPAANRPDDPAVAVGAFRSNGYRLQVNAPRSGLIYCADSLLPGWTARVNGRPATILPANYAFRAVAVQAGRSEIELSYWPPGLTLGLVLTALAVAIAAAALGGVNLSTLAPGSTPGRAGGRSAPAVT
jgi:hypothetical protein